MNIYLTIMVTVLVATQVVRIAQNHIHLKRNSIRWASYLSLNEQKKEEPKQEGDV